jgi:hypothetical protein
MRLTSSGQTNSGMGTGNVTPPVSAGVDFRNLLLSWNWQWSDRESGFSGSLFFTSDGVAHPNWTGDPMRWYVDRNGDLMVAQSGDHFVVRLTFDPQSNTFNGARDTSSQVQDGQHTQMKPITRR